MIHMEMQQYKKGKNEDIRSYIECVIIKNGIVQ
jgi:hypothetical protein